MEVEAVAVLQASRVAGMDPELADLERVYASLDIPGHHVELIEGRITVSPSASWWHSCAVGQLVNVLIDICRQRGWRFHTNLTTHVAATRERLIPDMMITPWDAPRFDDNEVYGHGALLVVEVVSRDSRKDDHDAKARAYAQAGVPLYLILDAIARPATVTLLSDPGGDEYRSRTCVTVGQSVSLPEPFGICLDTGALLG